MYARPTDCLAPGGQPNDAHNSPFTRFQSAKYELDHSRASVPIPLAPATNSKRSMWHRRAAGPVGPILFLSVALRALGSLGNAPSPEASRETQPGLGDRYNSLPHFVVRYFSR